MKSSLALLSIALLAVLPAFAQDQGSNAVKRPASKAHVLTRPEFDALVARPGKLVIIDVRRPDEVGSNGGFPVYLSIQINELEKSLAWIPKDRTVITVSNHAARGGRAADLLASKGFKVAGTIGAQNYEEAGGKLTKLTPPPKQADVGK